MVSSVPLISWLALATYQAPGIVTSLQTENGRDHCKQIGVSALGFGSGQPKGCPEAASLWEVTEFLTFLNRLSDSSHTIWKRLTSEDPGFQQTPSGASIRSLAGRCPSQSVNGKNSSVQGPTSARPPIPKGKDIFSEGNLMVIWEQKQRQDSQKMATGPPRHCE